MKTSLLRYLCFISLLLMFLVAGKASAAVTPKISAGYWHNVLLKSDGTLWTWGNNLDGQLGDGTTGDKNVPTKIGSDSTWSDIAAGDYHTVALKNDGTLWTWGWNYYGQLGKGNFSNSSIYYTPNKVGVDSNWSAIAAGNGFTLALKNDGTLWAWGNNSYGQLGDGTSINKNVPTQIGSDTWNSFAAGAMHVLAIKSDGTLWAWGINEYGRLGDGTTTNTNVPIQISGDTTWSNVEAGWVHSAALKNDGTLWTWGNNGYRQLGTGNVMDKYVPTQIGIGSTWSTVAAGNYNTFALKNDGTLWACGKNEYGQLGDGTTSYTVPPGFLTQIGTDTTWSAISAGYNSNVALKSDGTIWTWGYNEYGKLGSGTTPNKTIPTPIGIGTSWSTFSAGSDLTVALKNDGTLWTWGNNWSGQLGNGFWQGESKKTPSPISLGMVWSKVAAGNGFTLALKNDGTLWAWGSNYFGQLGDGTEIGKNVPAQIGSDTTWSAVDAGSSHTLALKNDGTLWAWGANGSGQLGDGTEISKNVPIQIGSDTTWSAVAAGGNHTVALKNDGTLWAWGINSSGQLGDGTTNNKNVPTQIGSSTTWSAVATGSGYTVALKNDGTLWAWGYNGDGNLGIGSYIGQYVPTQIGSGTTWSAVAVGNNHTVATKNDGTLWAWGANGSGQLGDGTTNKKNAPTQIGSDTTWSAVDAGGSHTLALKNDGILWAWGSNSYGQLGDGTAWQESPIFISSIYSAATALTNAASGITATSAVFNGTVSSNGASTVVTFEYGLTTGYGSTATATQSPLASTASGTAVTATVTGLTCGTTYHYRVKGQNSVGTTNGIDTFFTTNNCPLNAPGNIEVQLPTIPGQLIITWTKPAFADFNHVHIYRSTAAATLGTLIADNQTGIKYTDTDLASQTTYYYTVRSVNIAGNESTNTAQVFGTTLDTTPPAWVTGLTATNPGTGGTIDLTWSASSAPDFAHYRMYRSLNGTTYTQIRDQITGTSISDTGLTNGTIYYYSITAIDTAGNESEHSSLYGSVSATPIAVDMTPPAVVACTTSLSQPLPKTGDTVLHNWTNPGDIDFAALRIYASSVSGQLGSKVFEGSATTYTHSGLTPGSTYYYTYRSVDTFGNETTNTNQCSIAMVDEVAPLCPTGLTATVANNTIQLNWTRSGSSDVSNYLLYGDSGLGTIDYVTPLATISQGSLTTFSWTSGTLTPGAPYLFTLQAEDSVVPANVASSCGIVNVVVPPVSSSCTTSARINYPQTGNVIGGNSVNVMAEVPGGSEGDVQGILLQYRLSGSSDWSPLPVPVQDTSNSWYSLWDTSLLNAQYDLRAVVTCNSGNTDPAAGYITVTVDQTNPDLIVTSDMITSNLYPIAPSITVKRDLDTGGTTSLALPAGALDDNTTVNIADVPIPPALPSGYKEAGTYRNITFANSQHTLSNGQEAILEVSYLDDNNDGIVDGTTTLAVELQLCDYNGSTWTCFDSIVDTVNKKVKANVSQFSIYGLLVPTKPFGSGWSMLAVPLSPTNPAPSTVFSGASRINSYDPTTGAYPVPNSIQAGRAYWVQNGSAGILNVTGTETPNSTVNVPVKKGWNLVGNPFRYRVSIANLKVNGVNLATAEVNGLALATFYHYKNGVFETTSLQESGAIAAWKGYWFFSDVDGTLEIPAIPLL